MKTLIKLFATVLLFALCYTPAKATHLMGGDIWVEKDANGHHILKHKNFRDVFGIPAYTQTDFVAFKWNTVTSAWDPISAPVGMSLTMPMDPTNSGFLLLGVPYGVEMYNYKSDTLLLDSIFAQNGNGLYRFYANECCRNNAIQNLVVKSSMIIHCEYPYDNAVANQSPRYLAIPIFFGPVNSPWVYNPLPFDPDADSIAWAVDTPVCAASTTTGAYTYCGGYTTPPSVATGPFTLNNVTGQLDWTPSMQGNFVASFIVTEYRNGVEIGNSIRDMQYIVVSDSMNGRRRVAPEFVPVSGYGIQNQNSSSSYNYQYYYPGSPLNFTVGALDQDNGDVLTMSAFGDLINNNLASFAYMPTGNGNMVHGTFSWTPPVNETKDHMIVIRANDGVFSKDFTIVLKKYNAPNAINELEDNLASIEVYPNPAKANEAINFKVVAQENMKDMVLRIVDLTGKVVVDQEINTIHPGVSNIELDARLQGGFYIAQFIDTRQNKQQVIKFIVQ